MKSTCTATPSEIIAYYDSHTMRDTAKHFGIGMNTLSKVCHEMNYYKKHKANVKKPSAEDLQMLVEQKTNAEISALFGVPLTHVSWWMQSMKVKRNGAIKARASGTQIDLSKAIRFSQLNRFHVGHEYEYRFLDDNHVDERTMRTERGQCVQDCERHVTFWNGMYCRTILKVDLFVEKRCKVKEVN